MAFLAVKALIPYNLKEATLPRGTYHSLSMYTQIKAYMWCPQKWTSASTSMLDLPCCLSSAKYCLDLYILYAFWIFLA